jgi:hypothetical protein
MYQKAPLLWCHSVCAVWFILLFNRGPSLSLSAQRDECAPR